MAEDYYRFRGVQYMDLKMTDKKWEFEPSESDLKNLREWLKKMPHIVQDYDDEFLAAFIRGCKGKLQKTKVILENFNSLGFRYSYLFGNLNPLDQKLQEHLSVGRIFPLSKRLEDGSLIFVIAVGSGEDAFKYSVIQHLRFFFQLIYIFLWENDFGPGKLILLIDNKNGSIVHCKDFTPTFMRDGFRILQTSLPIRMKAIHIINIPAAAVKFFNIFQLIAPSNLKERVHIHSSMETLHEMIPEEILPIEYGGKEEDILTLHNRWQVKAQGYRDRLIQENLKMRSLDRFRPKLSDEDNISQTFTQLDID